MSSPITGSGGDGSGGEGGGGGDVLDDPGAMLGVSSHPYVEGSEPLHHHPSAPLPPSLLPHSQHKPSGGPVQSFLPRSRREYSYESEGAHSQSVGGGGYASHDGDGGEEDNYQSYDESDFDSDASLESDEDDIPLPPSMLAAGFSGPNNNEFSYTSGEKPPLGLPTEASILTSTTNERRLTHRRDHGVQSRLVDGSKGSEVYFVGVIDILQQYNALKRAETFFKSFKYDSRQISAVDPKWYAKRFVDFTASHIQ